MKRILFAAAALAFVAAATPANAQIWIGATPDYGAGVQVGPFGVGSGPYYRHGWYNDYAYVPACHWVRERFVTPRGHVFYRSHRVCD